MIFVTGTDTGCGKTTVGRALARALRQRGVRVGVFKPVETGCAERDGVLVPQDALDLARAAQCDLPLEVLCPERLAPAASPERAASVWGRPVGLDRIAEAFEVVRRRSDFVIAEGAGGLLVPLAAGVTTADLVARLGVPALVVGRDALGTVNHTLLTLEALRRRSLAVIGFVLTRPSSEDPGWLENAQAIATHSEERFLGTLPYLPGASDDALALSAKAALDLDAILSHVPVRPVDRG